VRLVGRFRPPFSYLNHRLPRSKVLVQRKDTCLEGGSPRCHIRRLGTVATSWIRSLLSSRGIVMWDRKQNSHKLILIDLLPDKRPFF
jgi:hypothetical protein